MNVKLEIRDAVATVTLDRPEKLNALTAQMKDRLVSIFTELNNDPEVRSVVLTGNGRGFCAGGDIQTMREQTVVSGQERLKTAHDTVTAIANLDKPVIASVRGPVAGIGWSLVMACDLVVASETTTFHQSFKRIGIVPDGGSIYFLMQTLGPARAKELVYFGTPVSADQALDYGLINRVVPDAELGRQSRDLALELAAGPTLAFSLGKKLFKAVSLPSLQDFLQVEAWAQGLALFSRDHNEGASAFREKRAPVFQGS